MDKLETHGKLKWKKQVSGMWKKGLAAWEEYRNIVRAWQGTTWKAKALLELNLIKEVNNKKRFFKCIKQKEHQGECEPTAE